MGVNIFGFSRGWALLLYPLAGCAFGTWIDNLERERSTAFRDKSALFGRVLPNGQRPPPSWP